jgi:hypothetical protein
MAFRFRLSRVLDWYERQYRMEAGRLRLCEERSVTAQAELSLHRQSRLAAENQLLRMGSFQADDLRARELHRKRSMLRESQLVGICQNADRDLEMQRSVTVAAQRRVRLVEKLRDRKRDEFDYHAAQDLEQAAADSWLAGYARSLNSNDGISPG